MNPNVDPVFGWLDKATAVVSKAVTATGISVATAGVSTCAPTKPPIVR
jgi:hypothetical protein